jgi:integrase
VGRDRTADTRIFSPLLYPHQYWISGRRQRNCVSRCVSKTCNSMYTEPEIISSNDLTRRAYVKVYINGLRHRFYNGKLLSINCNPNRSKTIKERNKSLQLLCYNLRKQLENGWTPSEQKIIMQRSIDVPTIDSCISSVLQDLQKQDLSKLYKRDIEMVGEEFITFLKDNSTHCLPIQQLSSTTIDEFLKQFNHSATYYMNKRRTLGGIISRLVKSKVLTQNPVAETSRLKERATLHEAYTRDQLREVVQILEEQHPNLHLCALLMYGCFLRPHQEIRPLLRRDINSDITSISLSGNANKGGRIRTVFVPPYIRDVIIARGLHTLDEYSNIFTGTCDAFNESYFNTAWSRIKASLEERNVIGDKHTLYSFRHTAAINLYMKTKDLYKVQQAMGHSSMTTTLTYMRSLGVVNAMTEDDIPEL